MAAKPLMIHPAALDEVNSAVAWYLERSESAANRFVAELDDAIDAILQMPSRWPSGELGTRKYVLRRYPFAVVYRHRGPTTEVLAIAHGHRRPSYWKNRF